EADLFRILATGQDLVIGRDALALHQLDALVAEAPSKPVERPARREGPGGGAVLEDQRHALGQVAAPKIARRDLLHALDGGHRARRPLLQALRDPRPRGRLLRRNPSRLWEVVLEQEEQVE